MNKFKHNKLAVTVGALFIAASSSAYAATNLIQEGDFESGVLSELWVPTKPDFTTVIEDDVELSSKVVHLFGRTKHSHSIKQAVLLEPGKTYQLSAKAKTSGGIGFAYSYKSIATGKDVTTTINTYDSTGAWINLNEEFTVPIDDVKPDGAFKVWLKTINGTAGALGDVWGDDFVLVSLTPDSDNDEDGIIDSEDDDDDNDLYLDTDEIAAGTDPKDSSSTPDDNDGDFVSDVTDEDDDNDGVTDVDEAAAGTDPFDDTDFPIDTDFDGTYNWQDSDDDDDGYTDEDEIAAGTDPLLDSDIPADLDGDFISDATDPDIDGDGVPNEEDLDPLDPEVGRDDSDEDGYSNSDEIAAGSDPEDPLDTPADNDGDFISDVTDEDDDNDGVTDVDEVAAGTDSFDETSFPLDTDADGTYDWQDTDDDNDGFTDEDEIAAGTDPLDETHVPADLDGDFISDVTDTDIDGDGFANDDELAAGTDPLLIDDIPADLDGDFISDVTDTDIDGDGVVNDLDYYPYDAEQSAEPPGSKLSKAGTYGYKAGRDYWSAYDILGQRLDIMRLSVSASLGLPEGDEKGTAEYGEIDAWLAENPDWKWSTAEQFTEIRAFFDSGEQQENIDAFVELNGEWSTWARPGKSPKWLVITKDAELWSETNAAVFKYLVSETAFNQVAVGTTNAKGTASGPLLVRVVTFDPFGDNDEDGVINDDDAFMDDPTEWIDTDGDGVGDNGDVFPNDPAESGDADGDGIGDNADDDADNDGVLNVQDGFPLDANASIAFVVNAPDTLEGEALSIDASATVLGGAELTFSWTQLSGPDLGISTDSSIIEIGALPGVQVDEEVVLELTVTNGVHTATESVSFMLTAIPAFVTASAELTGGPSLTGAYDYNRDGNVEFFAGDVIELKGSNSIDTENSNLTYKWVQTRGPVIELLNADSANASFTVPSVGSDQKVAFRLDVTNGQSHEGAKSVSFINNATIKADDSSDGGSLGIWGLLLAGIALMRRKL